MRLSIVTLGHVHAEDLTALAERATHLEQLVLDVQPRSSLEAHRAELNRAVDAATADWILIVREREKVDADLAAEIALSIEAAKAWGFRIRTEVLYAGRPLRLQENDGELRLFHRRHFMRRGDLLVQGTVIRLASPLRAMSFASSEEHRQQLAAHGRRRSPIRRVLRWLGYLVAARTLDANTIRYLWIEAGFDQDGTSSP